MKATRFLVFILLIISTRAFSQSDQDYRNNLLKPLSERVQKAPESVFKVFYNAGINPTDHIPTDEEAAQLVTALALLPALHQRILKDHLGSISFMDNMPNNAFTSPIDTIIPHQLYNITIRAGIFKEDISQWATNKEQNCFQQNDSLKIVIEAGKMDALVYILLHEATHVVDAILDLTPHLATDDENHAARSVFTNGIWSSRNQPIEEYQSDILKKTRFRGGSELPATQANEVYYALTKTPFLTLYSMASWHEDLAELLTIYHLTTILNQPFHITIRQMNEVIFDYHPAKNELIKNRFEYLKIFYGA